MKYLKMNPNNLSLQEQEMVTRLGAAFMEPLKTAEILELNEDQVLQFLSGDNQFSKCFKAGKLQAELEIREGIIRLAKNNSAPAQTLSMKLIENLESVTPLADE